MKLSTLTILIILALMLAWRIAPVNESDAVCLQRGEGRPPVCFDDYEPPDTEARLAALEASMLELREDVARLDLCAAEIQEVCPIP